MRVEKLVAPKQVRMGTPYHVEAVVFSSVETPASLELFREGSFVARQEVTCCGPARTATASWSRRGAEGMQLYQIVVNSPRDTMPENNHWQTFTEVRGRPKVLRLYDPPDREAPLVQALQQQGLDVRSRPWQDLPHMLSDYLEYAALVFDNVPGFGISVSQMEVLERYVRDMGGGVLMLGGEKSFGAGGYYRTPLEKILPVDMDVPTKVSVPSLAMVMVIDRSDSMGSSVSGAPSSGFGDRTTKLEVAKIAAFSSMKLLNPFDQVGVLAFNAEWDWSVPMSEAGQREQIAGRLAALTHGGGTDLFKALQEGLGTLRDVPAVKKHLIALSDGLTPNMEFESLMRDAVADNITVTTVALGQDADRTLMDAIAHWGKGRSYYTSDALNIPRIFTAETILVSRSLIEEGPFQPLLQRNHELLRGVGIDAAPPLHGYVVTYGKPAAEVLLSTPNDDPVAGGAALRPGAHRGVHRRSGAALGQGLAALAAVRAVRRPAGALGAAHGHAGERRRAGGRARGPGHRTRRRVRRRGPLRQPPRSAGQPRADAGKGHPAAGTGTDGAGPLPGAVCRQRPRGIPSQPRGPPGRGDHRAENHRHRPALFGRVPGAGRQPPPAGAPGGAHRRPGAAGRGAR